jgi:predicted nucleotidyltransferase
MNKSTVIAKLREYEPELRAAGIMRISLFGSVARGDESSESDVDLMAEFDPAKQFSLLDMVGLENRLADILGVPVDLMPARALKDRVRERSHGRPCLPFRDQGCGCGT